MFTFTLYIKKRERNQLNIRVIIIDLLDCSSNRTVDVLLLKWGLECEAVSLDSFNADSPTLCGSNLPGNHTIHMFVIRADRRYKGKWSTRTVGIRVKYFPQLNTFQEWRLVKEVLHVLEEGSVMIQFHFIWCYQNDWNIVFI